MNDLFYCLGGWKAVPIALAIIPMTSPNNNVNETDKNLHIYELYPYGQSAFTEYDDDGTIEKYRAGKGVNTLIESTSKTLFL